MFPKSFPMKKSLFLFAFALLFFSATGQEMVTLKFVRPSKLQGMAAKIRITIQGNEYILKNGSSISVNVKPDFGSSLKIDCKVPLGSQTAYYLRPKPGEAYEFEVGFKFSGIYINLTSGQEAKLGETVQPVSDTASGKLDTKVNLNPENQGVGITAEKTDPSEAIRQEWLKRGGKVVYTSVMLTGTYFGMDVENFGKINGYGGGISFSQNWINLKIPQFKPGLSTWNSFNIGWGYDLMIYSYKFDFVQDPLTINTSVFNMSIPIAANIGWTLGLGKFLDEGNWHGVALTFKYRPSLMLNMSSSTTKITSTNPMIPNSTSTSSDNNAQFNAAGFGFDLDFSSYSATMEKLAPKPKTKFSFFFLPKTSKSPLFISLSLGISFYTR